MARDPNWTALIGPKVRLLISDASQNSYDRRVAELLTEIEQRELVLLPEATTENSEQKQVIASE